MDLASHASLSVYVMNAEMFTSKRPDHRPALSAFLRTADNHSRMRNVMFSGMKRFEKPHDVVFPFRCRCQQRYCAGQESHSPTLATAPD